MDSNLYCTYIYYNKFPKLRKSSVVTLILPCWQLGSNFISKKVNSTKESLCQEVLCHSLGQAENFAPVYCQYKLLYCNIYTGMVHANIKPKLYIDLYKNAENVPVLSSTNEVPI